MNQVSKDTASLRSIPLKDWLAIAILSLIAFGGRLLYHYYHYGETLSAVPFPDERNYYLGGAQLLSEQGLSFFFTPRSLWNGPCNILWVAALGQKVILIKLANLCLLALLGGLLWQLVYRYSGKLSAYIALLLLCAHIPFAEYGPTLLSEPPFITLLFIAIWILTLESNSDRFVGRSVLSGLVLALATLTRPTAQLLPVFWIGCAVLWFFIRKNELSRQILRQSLFIAFGFFLIVGPWLIKNYVYLDKVGIANGVGAVLYLGSDLKKDGDEPVYSEMQFDTIEVTRPYAHLDTEGDKRLVKASLQQILRNPEETFWLFLKKPIRFLFGTPVSYFFPFRDVASYVQHTSPKGYSAGLLKIIVSVLVTCFGLLGLLFAKNMRSRPEHFFITGLVVYFVLLHTVTFPIPRLALPIFPFFLVYGVVWCFSAEWRVARVGLGLVCCSLIWWGIGFSQKNGLSHEVTQEYREVFTTLQDLSKSVVPVRRAEQTGAGAFEILGRKPVFDLGVKPFSARPNQIVFVEFEAKTKQGELDPNHRFQGELFWSAKKGEEASASRRKEFLFRADGERRIFRVSPSIIREWKGEIGDLRLRLNGLRKGDGLKILSVKLAK